MKELAPVFSYQNPTDTWSVIYVMTSMVEHIRKVVEGEEQRVVRIAELEAADSGGALVPLAPLLERSACECKYLKKNRIRASNTCETVNQCQGTVTHAR